MYFGSHCDPIYFVRKDTILKWLMINFYETSTLTYALIINLNATSYQIEATSYHALKT